MKLFFSLLLVGALFGCNESHKSALPTDIFNWTIEGRGFRHIVNPESLFISCDPNCYTPTNSYITYLDASEHIVFEFAPHMFSFADGESAATPKLTLDMLKKHFTNMDIFLSIPNSGDEPGLGGVFKVTGLDVIGELVTLPNTDGLQLDFTSYKDNRLAGRIHGIVTVINHASPYGGDCDSTEAADCYTGENVYLPLDLEFNLPVTYSSTLATYTVGK